MTFKLHYCTNIISNCGFPVFNKFRTINLHMSSTLCFGISWLKNSQLNYTNLKPDGRTDIQLLPRGGLQMWLRLFPTIHSPVTLFMVLCHLKKWNPNRLIDWWLPWSVHLYCLIRSWLPFCFKCFLLWTCFNHWNVSSSQLFCLIT